MNPQVDVFFTEGCGRCALAGTPDCKVHSWPEELAQLRRIVLSCGLTEELKWGVPCYTLDKKNVVMLSAFKESATLSFFKGALLKDTGKILGQPGENSQAVRLFRFTQVKDVLEQEAILKAYIFEAIEIERAGLKVNFKAKKELVFAEELLEVLGKDAEYKAAFEALTPGRQRGYNLHFSAPKQSQTRTSRVEKCRAKVMLGKGFNDR